MSSKRQSTRMFRCAALYKLPYLPYFSYSPDPNPKALMEGVFRVMVRVAARVPAPHGGTALPPRSWSLAACDSLLRRPCPGRPPACLRPRV